MPKNKEEPSASEDEHEEESSEDGSDDGEVEADSTDSEDDAGGDFDLAKGITENSSDEEVDEEEEASEDDDDDEEIEDDEDIKLPETKISEIVTHDMKPKKSSSNVAEVDEYANDSSDEEDLRNTIGNVPIEWYNDYPHIGYDWTGSKIMKPKKDNEVDDFLKRVDDPNYWRTVKDRLTGENVVLTDEDVDLMKRLKKGHYPDPNFNPYADFIDIYTYEKMIHPMTNRPMTKAQFTPSIGEKRAVSKLVSRIKRSWQKPKVEKKKDEKFQFDYDLWEKEDPNSKRILRHISAPKMALPGHSESYNPPPEYLLNAEEEAKWNEQEPEVRKLNFLPKKYEALRRVPAYSDFVKERFERCLDLYLCPRARKLRANVDPEDLIPKLPKPKDLQPFPCIESIIYNGHEDVVRSISIEPKGQFFVSGSDDKTVKIWEIMTGRCMKTFEFDEEVQCVAWCPDESKCLVAVAAKKTLYIINPSVGDKLVVSNSDSLFKNSLSDQHNKESSAVDWEVVDEEEGSNVEWIRGIRSVIKHHFDISMVTWHKKGDYFASVLPGGGNKSVVIHQLTKRRSQVPFSKSKGLIQSVLFHPTRPYFFVATQRYVRIYNLMKQQLSKKLMTNCKHVSSMAIHPGGDNVIIGSFDLRLTWFDLDLSNKPYKTLRYHKKAIRNVACHDKYPLFASASDDGTVIVSHGMVYSDLMQNPLIVPVKVLRGHKTVESLGVLDCCFHPNQPWILSAGADKTIRLFT
ncbi:Ribosome biogenesis protein bop1-B [Halotydeus destructor]|nr:Ribosome biogenesis protein bop1-B [Halotydeus destructor]